MEHKTLDAYAASSRYTREQLCALLDANGMQAAPDGTLTQNAVRLLTAVTGHSGNCLFDSYNCRPLLCSGAAFAVRQAPPPPERKPALTTEQKTEHILSASHLLVLSSDLFCRSGIIGLLQKVLTMIDRGGACARIVAVACVQERIRRSREISTFVTKLIRKGAFRYIAGTYAREHACIVRYVMQHCRERSILALTGSDVLKYQLAEAAAELPSASRPVLMAMGNDGSVTDTPPEPVFGSMKDATVSTLSDDPLPLNGKLPRTGQCVMTEDHRLLRLGRRLGDCSGEGAVYETGDGSCVKILCASSLTPLRIGKIRKLIGLAGLMRRQRPDLTARIAFPEQIVCNARHEPVGFLMPAFPEARKLEAFNSVRIRDLITDVDRAHIVRMAVSLAELTAFCHDNRLILGDVLSPGNILFTKDLQACFIDMDSVQIVAGARLYRTTVGRDDLFSPEHIGRGDFGFIRNAADDVWSLQVILFMLLTDCEPYIRCNAGTLAADTRSGRYCFPDAQGRHPADLAGGEDGVPMRMLRKLPSYMIADFHAAFSADGAHFKEAQRFSAAHWLRNCAVYQAALPDMIAADPAAGRYAA